MGERSLGGKGFPPAEAIGQLAKTLLDFGDAELERLGLACMAGLDVGAGR